LIRWCRWAAAEAAAFLLAQGPEALAKLSDENLGLLPGSEMPALRDLVVVDELRICLLRPAPRRVHDLVGEHADRGGNRDVLGREVAVRALVIEAGRRYARIGEPEERRVIQHVVARQPGRLAVEGAADELEAARIVVEE